MLYLVFHGAVKNDFNIVAKYLIAILSLQRQQRSCGCPLVNLEHKWVEVMKEIGSVNHHAYA